MLQRQNAKFNSRTMLHHLWQKLFLLVFTSILLLSTSCESDDLLVQVSKDKTRAEAIKNGRHWDVPQAIFTLRGDNQDSILIQMSSESRDEPINEFQAPSTELMTFINIPFKVGRYPVFSLLQSETTTKSRVNYVILENDIEKYRYRLDPQEDHFFLSINEISPNNAEIKGNFELTFILEDSSAESAPSEILRKIEFTSGFYICEKGI